jgi:hypothetical protein
VVARRIAKLATMPLRDPMSQTKGTGLLGLSRSIREGYGERGREATLAALPQHFAAPYTASVRFCRAASTAATIAIARFTAAYALRPP